MNVIELATKLYKTHYGGKDLLYYKETNERHGNGWFFKYDGGVFIQIDIDDLHDKLMFDFSVDTTRKRTNIIDNLSLIAKKPGIVFNYKASEYINVKNGMVEVSTGDLLPHGRSYYSTIQLDFDYNKEAKCPEFLKAIKMMTLGDKEMIQLLQEWMGYLLVPSAIMQKMLIMQGTGSNMKSTLIEVMQWLIGKSNYTVFPLGGLSDKNNIFDMKEKLVNFSDEEESGSVQAVVDTQLLKKLISGGEITGTEKYKQSMKYESKIKLVLACNTMPLVTDTTYAWERRLSVIPFDYRVTEENKIPDFANKFLKQELPGIFNFAVEGYKRLMTKDKFTTCKRSEAFLQAHIQDNNAPATFILEELVEFPESTIPYGDVYDMYKKWSHDNGYRPCGIKLFGSRITNYFENHADSPMQVVKKRGTGNQMVIEITRSEPQVKVEEIDVDDLDGIF